MSRLFAAVLAVLAPSLAFAQKDPAASGKVPVTADTTQRTPQEKPRPSLERTLLWRWMEVGSRTDAFVPSIAIGQRIGYAGFRFGATYGPESLLEGYIDGPPPHSYTTTETVRGSGLYADLLMLYENELDTWKAIPFVGAGVAVQQRSNVATSELSGVKYVWGETPKFFLTGTAGVHIPVGSRFIIGASTHSLQGWSLVIGVRP